jgi:hypothetical protein
MPAVATKSSEAQQPAPPIRFLDAVLTALSDDELAAVQHAAAESKRYHIESGAAWDWITTLITGEQDRRRDPSAAPRNLDLPAMSDFDVANGLQASILLPIFLEHRPGSPLGDFCSAVATCFMAAARRHLLAIHKASKAPAEIHT